MIIYGDMRPGDIVVQNAGAYAVLIVSCVRHVSKITVSYVYVWSKLDVDVWKGHVYTQKAWPSDRFTTSREVVWRGDESQ